MSRPAVARIHLDNIVANYLLAKSVCPAATQALAVVKADAYGHGAVVVAKALAEHVPAFAVACIEEALELRAAGIDKPIVLLEGFFTPDELPIMAEQNFWTAVHSQFQIEQIAAAELKAPIPVWVKVDSGMHRLGFAPELAGQACKDLQALDNVASVTMMTHFANADVTDPAGIDVEQQMKRVALAAEGLDIGFSVANSAALLTAPQTRLDWVRPGIILYGSSPLDQQTTESLQLKPGMTLETKVIATRVVEPGESVGYGSRFVADKPTLVGTIAMGYADGYPRQAVEGTPVAVDGKMTRVIGRVSMDMMTVDLTGIEGAGVGSRVELWGEQVDANLVAAHCDTISYHLFTGVTRRVPRDYNS
ncbi:alanine racemase [Oceanobacter mangrovi]|uniref:alanine racemase n=1 Tax=Oceanobacter mangrovi TaxID=2862510 RepID=UPI001C8E934E|nr:alanine racemase [Oceanobacter mangrovi]